MHPIPLSLDLWRTHFSASTREVFPLSTEAGDLEDFQVLSQSEAVQAHCFPRRSQPAGIRQDERWQCAALAGPGAPAVALDLRSLPLKNKGIKFMNVFVSEKAQ